jgi:pimeloyl-ACP methyl ester carboxylesterase
MNRIRPRPAAALAAATICAAVIAFVGLWSAAAAPGPTPAVAGTLTTPNAHGPKPTVVLVHGAWADASSWSREITDLEAAGYPVFAPPDPLRSLSGDSRYLRKFLSTVAGPIILVGHSYGGAVITNAATGNHNVKALVYVDAFAPKAGEKVFGLTGAGSVLAGDPATLFDLRPYPGAPTGDADAYLKPAVISQAFAPDVSAQQQAVITATQRPITFTAGTELSGTPAWKTIPSWYLLGTQDRMITPSAQRMMAERAHSHLTEIRSSHVSLISHPAAVDAIILAAARATA